MTFDYARSRATAERLIDRFGKDALIRVPGENMGTDYNPIIGLPTDHAVRLVDNGTVTEADGATLITRRKMLVSTAGLSIVPHQDHSLVVDGVEHGISEVRPLAPGPMVVLFEVLLDR